MTDITTDRSMFHYAESVARAQGGRDDATPYALLAIAEALANIAQVLQKISEDDA